MVAGSRHGRGSEQVSLRLPEGMRDRIKAAADANSRSMNAEIIATLEEAYGTDDREINRYVGSPLVIKIEDLMSEIEALNKNIASLRDKGES